jgi:hypothetical protein
MRLIKLPERLRQPSRGDKRNFITSDETWAFTEQPKRDHAGNDKRQIPAYDLFNMFTADIIKEQTLFTR